jgi:hypothetical protein
MKTQVRKGVFETNSSSVHTVCLCDQSDYDKWKDGNLMYDVCREELVPPYNEEYLKWKEQKLPSLQNFYDHHGEEEFDIDIEDYRFLTWEEFYLRFGSDYETFKETKKINKKTTVVAFGYFGNDY